MKKTTFFSRFLGETRLGLVTSCLLITSALTQTLSAQTTYTCVTRSNAAGEINASTTWSTSPAMPTASTSPEDANIWTVGQGGGTTYYAVNETTSPVTFYGGTFSLGGRGTLNVNGPSGQILNLNNLSLDGGWISNGAAGAVTINLQTNTSINNFTLNSGTIRTNSKQPGRNILFTNCLLAGSGNITIAQWNPGGTHENWVEFTNTGVTTSGFTGTFTVAPGLSNSDNGGELKISCPTSGTFGVIVPAADATNGVTSNTTTYKSTVPGKLFFNPGAGKTCTLKSLNLGGVELAPGKYGLAPGKGITAFTPEQEIYIDSKSTGTITVIGVKK